MRTAAAGGHHESFGTGFQGRIPGIDVAAGHLSCPFGVAEVMRQGTATASTRTALHADSESVQYRFQCLIDLWRQSRLYTALQHQYPTVGERQGRRAATRFCHRDLLAQLGWQQRSQPLPDTQQRGESRRVGQDLDQQTAKQALHERARYLLFDLFAADIEQAVVIDPRGAGGFAGAAAEATIEVSAHGGTGLLALEDLLDLVDAAARAVELVAEQLVGWAGGGTKAAMDAGAQDPVGLLAVGGISYEIGKRCLHLCRAC